MLQSETVKIKTILVKSGYSLESINIVIKLHDENWKKLKLFGADKLPVVLKLPYLGNISELFEIKVQDLTLSTYN